LRSSVLEEAGSLSITSGGTTMEHDPRDEVPTAAPACRLTAAEWRDRVAAWRKVDALALDRRVSPGRVTTTYPRTDDLVCRIRALVDAERVCCSFLGFDVREDDEFVEVELTYPPGAETLLDRLEEEVEQFVPIFADLMRAEQSVFVGGGSLGSTDDLVVTLADRRTRL
jgi:hypothetical protein